MRRTLLSVLVAAVSFVVTAAVLVGGFQLVAGSSEPSAQGSSARRSADATQTAEPTPPTSPPADVDQPVPTGVTKGPFFGTGIGFSGGHAPAAGAIEPQATRTPARGLLSEDFRKLGLDDPTTVIDERLPDPCDVVDGTVVGPIVGPVLCLER
jgi:hypothetical protein